MDCPQKQILEQYLNDQLDEATTQLLSQHLDICEQCRDLLDECRSGTPMLTADATLMLDPSGDDEDLAAALPKIFQGGDSRLGNYRIKDKIGQGGMGVVFRAYDQSLHREVAVKLLAPQLAASKRARLRFLREARAAAGINHPNVVTIHSVDECEGIPFLVMEYIRGVTLSRRIKRGGKIDLISLVRISAQIAAGLEAAHEQGVIHRDIKPANIMLERGIDRVKITDFGLARAALDLSELTSQGRQVGTPAYMSPEQINGDKVDGRSDLFSLGCVMYAMVSGQSPFQGKTTIQAIKNVTDKTPPSPRKLRPDLPEAISQVIDRLLAKDPQQRYQFAGDVSQLLNKILALSNQTATDSVLDLRAIGFTSRWRRWKLATGAILLLGAATTLGTLPWWNSSSPTSSAGTVEPNGEATSIVSDRQHLTVSRSGAANTRSLNEAIELADPGATIEIIDDESYTESILIEKPDLSIVGTGKTTLRHPGISGTVIDIANAPGTSLRGLRIDVGVNHFAVRIRGNAAGVELVDLDLVKKTNKLANAWCVIYVDDGTRGSSESPIRIHRCTIESEENGLIALGNQSSFAHLHISNNRFFCASNPIQLHHPSKDVVVHRNLIVGGKGLVLRAGVREAEAIRVSNNTFYGAQTWLEVGDSTSFNTSDIRFVANLIVGGQSIGSDSDQLDEILEAWKFENSYWLPGRLADQTEVAKFAIVLKTVSFLSEDRGSVDYLRYSHDSALANGGVGGELPFFVGALEPKPVANP